MQTYTPYTRPETYFFLAVLIVVGVLAFLVFLPFLSTLIIAATLAVVIYPAHKKVVEAVKGNSAFASAITLVCLFFLIIVPLYLIAAQIFNEANNTYQYITSEGSSLSTVADTFEMRINRAIESVFPGVNVDLGDYVAAGSQWLLKNVGAFFSSTISIGVHLFLGIIALYYFIKDGKMFVHTFESQSPIPREHALVLIDKLRLSIRSIIGGSLTVAVMQGVVSGIGYAIFGIPNPALWGMLTGLSALVPGVGTSLVLVPAVAYAFAIGSLFQGIGLGIWALLAVGLLDNFLSPRLIGKGLKIHPLIILFSIIGGLSFYGPVGFILGPLTISLFMALFGIYRLIVKTEEHEDHHA